jgi:hypothetical protein
VQRHQNFWLEDSLARPYILYRLEDMTHHNLGRHDASQPSSNTIYFTGWKYAEDMDMWHHNLQVRPLQIRTNSRIGSGDLVCIYMFSDVTGAQRLYLCIHFDSQIFISIWHSQNFDECKWDVIPVQNVSLSQNRTWTVTKTPISYRITGDDIEPLDLTCKFLQSGEIAKSINFGWLEWHIKSESRSSVHYLTQNKGKSNACFRDRP